MKKYIIANWKCNPVTLKEAKNIYSSVKKKSKVIKNTEVVICPPYIYLTELLKNKSKISIGAENGYFEEKGAFTGEISLNMLKFLGCKYIIIGHSERRNLFGENDDIVNKKLKVSLSLKLNPVFCFGENFEQNQKGKTFKILEDQIKKGIDGISKKLAMSLIFAYEPIWAIGTGKSCDADRLEEIYIFIRKILTKKYGRKIADKISILYGGSVNSENILSYMQQINISGVLVGGASLNPEEFIKIIKRVEKNY